MQNIRLAELMSSLSKALDLTEGQPEGHCVRCCWIGVHVGQEYKLDDSDLSDLYYTTLMKDLGCSSNAARVCSLFQSCDRELKREVKYLDGSLSQRVNFIFSHTAPETNFVKRMQAILELLQNTRTIGRELMETRCTQGAHIARKLRLSENVAQSILNLDEHWDGRGLPQNKRELEIPVVSQIALLAQVAEVFHQSYGEDRARKEIISRSGSWFNPEIVGAFEIVSEDKNIWEMLNSDKLQRTVNEMEPGRQLAMVDEDYLDDIAIAFSQVIDAKSPFTAGHSDRVALYTDLIAEQLGLEQGHRRWLKRGALLHDLGKLGVSNSVLDKPGRPNRAEWEAIKMHPVYSYEILSGISVFENILPLVRGHHERLDGNGYPDGLSGDEISFETRIVTVADIYDALTADRPYRKALPAATALTIMSEDLNTAIDADCFNALTEALKNIGTSVAA